MSRAEVQGGVERALPGEPAINQASSRDGRDDAAQGAASQTIQGQGPATDKRDPPLHVADVGTANGTLGALEMLGT
jgi:hypothetical protein